MSTPETTSRVSFGTKLWSLRWSLLLSIALGLIMVFFSFLDTGVARFTSLVWVVVVCVALTMAKVFFRSNELVVAAFGFLGILLSKVLIQHSLIAHEGVDVVRVFLYPVLGWTVVRLEKSDRAGMANTLEQWVFPMVILPLTGALVLALTESSFVKMIAEVVFSSGCALILRAQKVPQTIEPLAIVVISLVTGAVAALKESAVPVVADAYASLKGLVTHKSGSGPNADDLKATLQIMEKKPGNGARQSILREELKTAKVQEDTEIVKQAQALLQLVRQNEPEIARKFETL